MDGAHPLASVVGRMLPVKVKVVIVITGSSCQWPATYMPYHSLINHCVPYRP